MISKEDSLIQDIEKDLAKLEDLRARYYAMHKARLCMAPLLAIVGISVSVCLAWMFWIEVIMGPEAFTFLYISVLTILLVGIAIACNWARAPKLHYLYAFKSAIFPSISNSLGNIEYRPHGGLSVTRLLPSKIIPTPYDIVKKEDYFRGKYKGIKFEIVEMTLLNERTMTVLFTGVVVLLSMKRRKFQGHTVLLGSFEGETNKIVSPPDGLKQAKFPDPVFNSQFKVYTNDQVEARYLLDPHIMQKIIDMRDHYRGDAISAAYYDSKMLVMINTTNNHFEPPEISCPVARLSVLMMRQELQDVIGLIDYLEMHNKR